MIGGFEPVSLAWINKIAIMGYTWFSVYESVHSYEDRVQVPQYTMFRILNILTSGIADIDTDALLFFSN